MISLKVSRKPQNDDYARLADYVRDAKPSRNRKPGSQEAGAANLDGVLRGGIQGSVVDDYQTAARYIADYLPGKKRPGEKLLCRWYEGCMADSYDLAIKEVLATQAMNTRVQAGKTYHLIVSFRPEDEAKLKPELFMAIEKRFADALGFSEYQRHCGVHKNTDNIHMHVSYNMIHPQKLTKHDPWRDYRIRDGLHRILEKELGLARDNGVREAEEARGLGETKREDHRKESHRAKAMEAHSGQESFIRYAREKLEFVLAAIGLDVGDIAGTTSWELFHTELAKHGLAYVPHGNGAVFRDLQGTQTCKASLVDRKLSLGAMTRILGPYQPCALSQEEQIALERTYYEARPLQRGPERDALWQEYRQAMDQRIARLKEISDTEKATLARLDVVLEQSRSGFDRDVARGKYGKTQLARLHRESRALEARKKAEIKAVFAPKREQVKKDIPFSTWNSFLQGKAGQGDELALDLLRRKNVSPEKLAPVVDRDLERRQIREKWRGEQQKIRNNQALNAKGKRELVSVLKMKQLQELEAFDGKTNFFQGMTWEISKQGTVVFKLPQLGGEIRDTGDKVFLRGGADGFAEESTDKLARAALSFARTKWGPDVYRDQESGAFVPMTREIKRELERRQRLERAKNQGMGR